MRSWSSAATATGCTTGADLASCLVDTHVQQVKDLIATSYGTPAVLSTTVQKCQSGASKESQKLLDKQHKLITTCKDKVAAGKLPPTTDCAVETADDLATAQSKGATKIVNKCPNLTGLTFATPCTGVTTATGLAACALGAYRTADDALSSSSTAPARAAPPRRRRRSPTRPRVRRRADEPLPRRRLPARERPIRVVVQDIQRNLFGIGQFGGQIIDADLQRGTGPERDNFEEWPPRINIENTAHYTSAHHHQRRQRRPAGGAPRDRRRRPARLREPELRTVAGFGFAFPPASTTSDLPVEVQTDYILEPGTQLRARRDDRRQHRRVAALNIFFGEYLNGSGQVRAVPAGLRLRRAAGRPHAARPRRRNPCNFVAYAGYEGGAGVSYGYMHDDARHAPPSRRRA